MSEKGIRAYPVEVMREQPTPGPLPAAPAERTAEEPRRPDPLAITVATEIARMRREAGLSERGAARKLGTSQTQLRRMEDPRYLPSLRSLARVAAAYGYSVAISFDSLEKKKPAPAPTRKKAAAPARAAESPKAPARRVTPSRAAPRRDRARPARRDRGTRG